MMVLSRGTVAAFGAKKTCFDGQRAWRWRD